MAIDLSAFECTQKGYSAQHESEFITFEVDGGDVKQRVGFIGKPRTIQVEWQLSETRFNQFMALYYGYRDGGGTLYSMMLPSRSGGIVKTDFRFVSGIEEVSRDGKTVVARATIKAVNYAD